MAERPHFQELQYRFAAHVRDPAHVPAPPDIEDRRMQIYRELFFNSTSSLLASTFPVLRKILGAAGWEKLIRDFYAHHISHTPLFPEVPQELLAWLREERQPQPDDLPFLLELAHYEWVELAISIQEDPAPDTTINPAGDLLAERPVVSPLAWSLAYDFPVHRISPDFQPRMPGESPTFLIVYRTVQDEVAFMEINPVTARLMALLEEAGPAHNGRALLLQIVAELQHPQPEAVVQAGLAALTDMRERGIVLGTQRS